MEPNEVQPGKTWTPYWRSHVLSTTTEATFTILIGKERAAIKKTVKNISDIPFFTVCQMYHILKIEIRDGSPIDSMTVERAVHNIVDFDEIIELLSVIALFIDDIQQFKFVHTYISKPMLEATAAQNLNLKSS